MGWKNKLELIEEKVVESWKYLRTVGIVVSLLFFFIGIYDDDIMLALISGFAFLALRQDRLIELTKDDWKGYYDN